MTSALCPCARRCAVGIPAAWELLLRTDGGEREKSAKDASSKLTPWNQGKEVAPLFSLREFPGEMPGKLGGAELFWKGRKLKFPRVPVVPPHDSHYFSLAEGPAWYNPSSGN